MMEIGAGSSEQIQNTISKMVQRADDLSGQVSTGGVSFGNGSRVTLTPGDCVAF